MSERERWLRSEPQRYAALQPEGEAIVAELTDLAVNWNQQGEWPVALRSSERPTLETVVALGSALEPDFVLMMADRSGAFRLVAGAVAFPSGWALEEKVGHPLDFIHGAVPGLNPVLGSPIQQFLSRLKPGPAFLRSNWGLAATDELNLHPSRRIPPPGLPVRLNQLWLRVEDQALVALPKTGGVLFGIRIERYRLDQIVGDREVAGGLQQALESMPEAVATYKGLASIRGPLADLLKKAEFF